jgi:hypothetical protein
LLPPLLPNLLPLCQSLLLLQPLLREGLEPCYRTPLHCTIVSVIFRR